MSAHRQITIIDFASTPTYRLELHFANRVASYIDATFRVMLYIYRRYIRYTIIRVTIALGLLSDAAAAEVSPVTLRHAFDDDK